MIDDLSLICCSDKMIQYYITIMVQEKFPLQPAHRGASRHTEQVKSDEHSYQDK